MCGWAGFWELQEPGREDLEEGPQCVKWCPKDALTLATPEMVAQKARKTAVAMLLQELVAG